VNRRAIVRDLLWPSSVDGEIVGFSSLHHCEMSYSAVPRQDAALFLTWIGLLELVDAQDANLGHCRSNNEWRANCGDASSLGMLPGPDSPRQDGRILYRTRYRKALTTESHPNTTKL
jgi:hypothetical protein